MVDIIRQTIITPEDLGEKDVFVINDINFVIPPTQITVNKEDLVYRWKTLRTKTATKIPSGHGQIAVHVTIPFTGSQLLVLHRLLVEFRQSPFCYVDNRYLRETIVPEWPWHQNMAFTMTGITVSPMPGSSDSWICELDLLWFNYFPYMHNFLYRDDWVTNGLRATNPIHDPNYYSYTIGWSLNEDTYERTHLKNPVATNPYEERGSAFSTVHKEGLRSLLSGQPIDVSRDEYSVVTSRFRDQGPKNLYEMQVAHSGIEFDLLPMPDNMGVAYQIAEPKNSRIYVRFINFLQRDALYKNFGINVERDIISWEDGAGKLWDSFFNLSLDDDGLPIVYSLHSDQVPRSLRNKWISEMQKHNFGIRFCFHVLSAIKFPGEWSDIASKKQNSIIREVVEQLGLADLAKHTKQFVGSEEDLDELIAQMVIPTEVSEAIEKKMRENAKTILKVTVAEGYPVLLGMAAVANAWNESLLDNFVVSETHVWKDRVSPGSEAHKKIAIELRKEYNATHPTSPKSLDFTVLPLEQSVGLFQLNLTAGVGKWATEKGWTSTSLLDPYENTRIMIQRMAETSDGTEVLQAIADNTSLRDLAYKWCYYLERPANKSKDASDRSARAAEMWPDFELSRVQDVVIESIEEAKKRQEQREIEVAEQQEAALTAALTERATQEEVEVSDEATEQLATLLALLDQEGWKYYEADTTISNVWQKFISIEVAHSGRDELIGRSNVPEQFLQEGIVLTNVSGTLQHVVASLPILSQEFPTQQHLGSIEPMYELEFAILDDQGNLEGISQTAQFIEGMRGLLQKQARQFRPIPDGWCVSTSTFITRLFGSYEENDIKFLTQAQQLGSESSEVIDYSVKKRTVIARSSNGTVEGNPGMSFMQMTLEETNPYEEQRLISTASGLEDKEEMRRKIIQGLWKLEFIEKIKKSVLPLLLLDLSDIDFTTDSAGSADYGKLSIGVYSPAAALAAAKYGSPYTVSQEGGQQYLILNTDKVDPALLEKLGIQAEVRSIDEDARAADPSAAFSFALIQDVLFRDSIPGIKDAIISDFNFPTQYIKIPLDSSGLSDYIFTSESAKSGFVTFDFAKIAYSDPELVNLPIEKLTTYYDYLVRVVATGERLFAEELSGGIPNDEIRAELYDLPVDNHMWQSWQHYLEGFIKERSGLDAVTYLYGMAGYPVPEANLTTATHIQNAPHLGAQSWGADLDVSEKVALDKLVDNSYGSGSVIDQTLEGATFLLGSSIDVFFAGWQYFKSTVLPISATRKVSDAASEKVAGATDKLVSTYILSLPLQYALPDLLRGKIERLIGDIISAGYGKGEPAISSLYEQLYGNAYSCGNFVSNWRGQPLFQTTPWDPTSVITTDEGESAILVATAERGHFGGFMGALQQASAPTEFLGPGLVDAIFGTSWAKDKAGRQIAGAKALADAYGDLLRAAGYDEEAIAQGESWIYDKQRVGNLINSPFIYKDFVKDGIERGKLKWLKSALATIADDILYGEPDVLKALGLDYLATLDSGRDIKGTECYPDLDLPTHPYYGDRFQVSPDFYMWNIYEDAKALSPEYQEKIYTNMEEVVTNCYKSVQRLKGGYDWDESKEIISVEDSLVEPISMSTALSPEGTDSQRDGAGPTSSMFAPTKDAAEAEKTWTDGVKDPRYSSSKPKDYMDKKIRLETTEGEYGAGGGIHYPTRVGPGTYEQLKGAFEQTEQLFGSKAGYNNEYLTDRDPSVKSTIKDTNLAVPEEYAQSFDVVSLRKLARDSAKDLMSYKMTLRRAFPTFKLFFIEEDEQESRFLNFDDFYSYNAVKEFSVVMSRKMAADTAVITLQNVSGTLDGTKRNAIVDLDYFDKTAGKKLDAAGGDKSDALAENPIFKDTDQDQPFGAVVLRPGLNVQLRAGFSNDPDNLEVLISGRIVDVNWNKTGDLAEIMVQSFGVELIQAIKGSTRDGSDKSYATTHELLGSMMLEPEVTHFGRWEFGQLFQLGEASDHRLDFTDYSREGFLGRFQVTDALTRWVTNHPKTVIAAGLGLTIGTALLAFGGGGSLAKVFGRGASSTARLEKALITEVAKRGVTVADDAAGVAASALSASDQAVLREATRKLAGTTWKLGRAGVVSKELRALMDAKVASHLLELSKVSTVAQGAAVAEKIERYVHTALFKSQWMTKPWMTSANGVAFLTQGIGWKPMKGVFYSALGAPFTAGLTAFAAGVTLDAVVAPILRAMHKHTIGKAKKFFTRAEVHLFLTPQDDNLYPPHPKDYMTLTPDTWIGKAKDLGRATVTLASRATLQTDTPGMLLWGGLVDPSIFISKKVNPSAAEYVPVSTTIWDIFHEMSLRHPGWVYGARPYGTKFRYTMFFGVPSQRYWAAPASNMFIKRMIDLRRALEGLAATPDAPNISREEFERLYGAETLLDLKEEIERDLTEEVSRRYGFAGGVRTTTGDIITGLDLETQLTLAYDAIEIETDKRLTQHITAIALREYLRGLELRFRPFRRYHLLDSDRDIIWNGLVSSEQSVINAVDVTYFTNEDNPEDGEVATEIFKAHTFIPGNMLRIAPIRYPNCKGYQMAMRYGMGELMHRMKEMYRGEIIVLGNPRLRPIDICILADSYNDMVGPIEIEQVVHTMSHETGFITEIKPGAVVFGNEISSWPVLSAMKMFALAMKDTEERIVGSRRGEGEKDELEDIGFLSSFADHMSRFGGAKFSSLMASKYQKEFGDGLTLADAFGNTKPPESEFVDGLITDAESLTIGAATTAGAGMGLLGGATLVGGGIITGAGIEEAFFRLGQMPVMTPSTGVKTSVFFKNPKIAIGSLVGLTGIGLATGGALLMTQAPKIDFPSLAFLIGGPILLLRCLRNDAVILVPLMKSGHPIVSGLAYNDPTMIWKEFKGEIGRYLDETLTGGKDLLSMYERYGTGIWNKLTGDHLEDMTGESDRPISSGGF